MNRRAWIPLAQALVLAAAGRCAEVNIVVLAEGWDAAHEAQFTETWQQLRDDLFRDEPYSLMKKFYEFIPKFQPSEQLGCSRQYDTEKYPKAKRTENPYYSRKTRYKLYYTPRHGCSPKDPPEDLLNVPDSHAPPPDDKKAICQNVRINSPAVGSAEEAAFRDQIKKDVEISTPTVILIITPDRDIHAGRAASEEARELPARIAQRAVITMTSYDVKNNVKDIAAMLAHELGHAVYRLGDEYSDGGGTCDLSVQSGAPNLHAGRGDVPWKRLIDNSIVDDEPQPGGMMNCKTGVVHPTSKCRMLDQYKYDGFCAVCQEAMFHAVMEKSTIVLKDQCVPKTDAGDVEYTWTPLKITVHTKEEAPLKDCDPRYVAYWELNGKRLGFFIREPEPGGARYEATIGDIGTPIRPGYSILRFFISDGAQACQVSPVSKLPPGKTPWDTCGWTIHAKKPPADMKIPWLEPKKALK